MPIELDGQFFVNAKLGEEGRPVPVNPGNIHSIEITESIDNLVPVVKMNYTPMEPLHEYKPLTGRDSLQLEIGMERNSGKQPLQEYELFNISVDNGNTSGRNNPAMELQGLHSFISQLLQGRRKSYSGLVSDAVKKLVKEYTQNTEPISDTHPKKTGPFIQPGWSDAKQFRYFQNSAISTNGIGAYKTYFRNALSEQAKTEFVFRSLDELYSQDIAQNNSGDEIKLIFGVGVDSSNTKKEDDPQEGPGTYSISIDYEWSFDLASNLQSLGKEMAGYNFDDAEWVIEDSILTELQNHVLMSDKFFFHEQELFTEGSVGRSGYKKGLVNSDFTEDVEYSSVGSVIEGNSGILRLPVVVRDSVPNVGAGSKVKMVIVDEHVSSGFQKVLSGKWIVHTKTEYIDEEYFTKFILMREGINSPRNNPEQFGEPRAGTV